MSEQNARGFTTNYVYEPGGTRRLQTAVEPALTGQSEDQRYRTTYTYDDAGNVRTTTDARNSVTTTFYEAGHMMYIDQTSLAQLKRDAAAFVQNASRR